MQKLRISPNGKKTAGSQRKRAASYLSSVRDIFTKNFADGSFGGGEKEQRGVESECARVGRRF